MQLSILNIENNPLLSSGFIQPRHVFTILAIVSILYACRKADEPDRLELIKGIWINTHINQTEVQTNLKFVMEFTNETEFYSVGVVFDSVNKKWIDRSAYDYSLSGDRLIISGTDVLGDDIELEFGIISVSSSALVCRVNSFEKNGALQFDNKIYTFKKALNVLTQEISGTWYGKATYSGSTDTDYHYWNYLPNGTYEYYYREDPDSSQWIKKTDNEGRYYLYDNLLATNWSNDIFSGNPGLDYECWDIEITGNVMKWTGSRANGLVATYEMIKVSGPPVVLNLHDFNNLIVKNVPVFR